LWWRGEGGLSASGSYESAPGLRAWPSEEPNKKHDTGDWHDVQDKKPARFSEVMQAADANSDGEPRYS